MLVSSARRENLFGQEPHIRFPKLGSLFGLVGFVVSCLRMQVAAEDLWSAIDEAKEASVVFVGSESGSWANGFHPFLAWFRIIKNQS